MFIYLFNSYVRTLSDIHLRSCGMYFGISAIQSMVGDSDVAVTSAPASQATGCRHGSSLLSRELSSTAQQRRSTRKDLTVFLLNVSTFEQQ